MYRNVLKCVKVYRCIKVIVSISQSQGKEALKAIYSYCLFALYSLLFSFQANLDDKVEEVTEVAGHNARQEREEHLQTK